jgi:hypothetical protein
MFVYGITLSNICLSQSSKHTVLQHLESTVHAYNKLRRSATAFISYNSGLFISYKSGLSVGHVNEFIFVLGTQINKQTFLEVLSAIQHQMQIYVFLQQGLVYDIRSILEFRVLCSTIQVLQSTRLNTCKGGFTHNILFPCRFKDRFTHTMPFPCHDPAIHTGHCI